MDITKPVEISVNDESGPDPKWRKYGTCTITYADIRHLGTPVDFTVLEKFDYETVRLTTGTSFSRDECTGTLRFTTPGLANEIELDLKHVSSIDQHHRSDPRAGGCLITVAAVATSALTYILLSSVFLE
jgi:hypothetical protein